MRLRMKFNRPHPKVRAAFTSGKLHFKLYCEHVCNQSGIACPREWQASWPASQCMAVWAGAMLQGEVQPEQRVEARHPVHLSIRLESQDLSDRCGILAPLCDRFVTLGGLHNAWDAVCKDLVWDLLDAGFSGARREAELLAEWVHRHSTTGLISCRKLWLFNNR